MRIDYRAMIFAIEAHNSTNHNYDGKPYYVHLAIVNDIAKEFIDIIPDQCQDEVLAACWLHDTIEDCRLTYNDIKKEFGETVAEIVFAVSNDKGKNRKERAGSKYYDGIKRTAWATFVKLCDRLANIRYSYESKSRMLDVYSKEHFEFVESILPLTSNKGQYRRMINEMESYLNFKPTNQ